MNKGPPCSPDITVMVSHVIAVPSDCQGHSLCVCWSVSYKRVRPVVVLTPPIELKYITILLDVI